MSFVHGRGTVFKLDNAAGALIDISSFFKSATGLVGKSDRPETQTFGQNAKRYQLLGLRDGGPISLGGFYQQTGGTFVHGRQARILTDQYALYSYLKSASISRTVDLPETQVFGDNWKRRGVIGLKAGTLSFGGLFDSVAGGPDAVMSAYLGTATPGVFSLAPGGFAIGNLAELLQAQQGGYSINTTEEGAVEISGDFMSDDAIELGVSLHDILAAETTSGSTVNYTGVDEVSQTTGGWVAHLHVIAYSGFTSVTIKLQDSTDNVSFADLTSGAFTAATAVTAQRLDGGTSATVRRYVRAVATTVGSGSITFAVVFSRRSSAYGTAGTYRGFYELFGNSSTQTFEYGPEGSVAGKVKYTGESRLQKLDLNLTEDGTVELSADLVTDNTVTRTTF